jgi:SAM-dependent methyltransferase
MLPAVPDDLTAGRRLFGIDPAAYATGRPGYPEEIYEMLTQRCGLGPDTPTLEIGPGAGQATDELLRRGARPLIAVEPDPSFAAYLADRFADRVEVHNVPFEELEIEPASVQLAASATAWHWVDPKLGLPRLARAVAAGGCCALWWTLYHDPAKPDDLYRALDPIMSPLPIVTAPAKPGRTQWFALDRDARIADLRANGAFGNVRVDELRWEMLLTPERARALFGTMSPVLALPDSEREDVLGGIASVVDEQFGGLATRSCVSILYTARRTG